MLTWRGWCTHQASKESLRECAKAGERGKFESAPMEANCATFRSALSLVRHWGNATVFMLQTQARTEG